MRDFRKEGYDKASELRETAMHEDTQYKPIWHPITEDIESLPENEGYYLITYYNSQGERDIDIDFYLFALRDFAKIDKEDVTAWAELPEPYVEAGL